jgi:ribosomal-protein-serine acetyltransferase
MSERSFSALRCGEITLYPITEANFDAVWQMFSGFPDSPYMLSELDQSYRPTYDQNGRQTIYGFYALLGDTLAGMSLLGISSWPDARGYTGADTLLHMRGRGVAPNSKPHLFYLGFYLLGLNRIETGCLVSNTASRRSIEKTPGFIMEGIMRKHARNPDGEFEDEYRYGILREDWVKLYNPALVEEIS